MRYILFSIFLFIFFKGYSQSTASKQVTTFSIEAPQLNTKKTIWVYLPKNYQKSSKKYPVVYMHDAQNLFDKKTSYVGEWKVDETLDSLQLEVIVIGIEHGGDKRIDELTPYVHPKYKGGNGNNYLEFIVKTLKPYIDANFPTLTSAKNTTIFGSSLGGLISYYGLLKYPNIFGNAGVFSPSFWYSDRIFKLTESYSTIQLKKKKIYMATGGKEPSTMVPDHYKMEKILKDKKLKTKHLQSFVRDGKEHNEIFWSEEFVKAIQWLLK